jgi:two-component system chemotaxis sensor kinase CheA
MRLAVVDRIEEVDAAAIKPGAGQLRVQLGESILPIAAVPEGTTFEGKVRLFRLNDGACELAYAFSEVIDMETIQHDVIPAEAPGAISGVTLIGGEPAELVDTHWLFAHHLSATARPAEQAICRLPSDDPWMQNILRPIVEAAGYRVVGDDHDGKTDLVIASQGSTVGKKKAGRTIWLRADPDATDAGEDSIYRYDRAGLLMALKAAGAGRGR